MLLTIPHGSERRAATLERRCRAGELISAGAMLHSCVVVFIFTEETKENT